VADSNPVEEGDACKLQGPQDAQYNRALLAHQRIALIGAGNMAETILAGLLRGWQLTPTQFTASDIVQARHADFTRTYAVTTTAILVRQPKARR
jgi:hypothetical protein